MFLKLCVYMYITQCFWDLPSEGVCPDPRFGELGAHSRPTAAGVCGRPLLFGAIVRGVFIKAGIVDAGRQSRHGLDGRIKLRLFVEKAIVVVVYTVKQGGGLETRQTCSETMIFRQDEKINSQ